MTRGFSLSVLLMVFTQAAQANVLCVGPDRLECHATIQGAIDASQPRDTVLIYPHPSSKGYREHVRVEKDDLILAGVYTGVAVPLSGEKDDGKQKGGKIIVEDCPPQILDNCETAENPTSCGGTLLTIAAQGVEVRNLTFRHPNDHIQLLNANRTQISNICSYDGNRGISGTGDNVSVRWSKFQGIFTSEAVSITGDHTKIQANRALNTDGFLVTGRNAVVTGNFMNVTTDNSCVHIEGEGALIGSNILKACEVGISTSFSNGTQILSNVVTEINDDTKGIDVSGDNMEIAYNTVQYTSDSGLVYLGQKSKIHHNVVELTGADGQYEPGIRIGGDDNVISNNSSFNNTFAGILNENGSRNVFEYNSSFRNGRSGIRIVNGDSNKVRFNSLKNNQGEGINNGTGATNTVILGNEAVGNRTDICNDGTIDEFSGNTFVTGGSATACVVES